jgi:hypothetical protein
MRYVLSGKTNKNVRGRNGCHFVTDAAGVIIAKILVPLLDAVA